MDILGGNMEYINPYYLEKPLLIEFIDDMWQHCPKTNEFEEQYTAKVVNKGPDLEVKGKTVNTGDEFILAPRWETYKKIAEVIELNVSYTIEKDEQGYFITTSNDIAETEENGQEKKRVSDTVIYQNQQISASVDKKRDSIESQQAIKIAIDLILADKLNLEAKMTKEQADTLSNHVKTILSIINNSYDIEAAAPAPPPHTDEELPF